MKISKKQIGFIIALALVASEAQAACDTTAIKGATCSQLGETCMAMTQDTLLACLKQTTESGSPMIWKDMVTGTLPSPDFDTGWVVYNKRVLEYPHGFGGLPSLVMAYLRDNRTGISYTMTTTTDNATGNSTNGGAVYATETSVGIATSAYSHRYYLPDIPANNIRLFSPLAAQASHTDGMVYYGSNPTDFSVRIKAWK